MRSTWRWGALALAVAALVSAPSVVAALPVEDPHVPPATLLARVRASAGVSWSGYGESRGALVLPDAKQLGDLPSLLAGTTRVRAWWRGPRDHRLDDLSLASETDTSVDQDGTWTFSAADERGIRVEGDLPVHLPAAGDLLAPVLGRRLAGTAGVRLSWLPGRRVAGRTAAGLRITPADPASTTVGHVDLWAEPRTGLPLRVDVVARGQSAPAITSLLLDLSLARPSAARTRFVPPMDAFVSLEQAPDLASSLDRVFRYLLPPSLAGLPRTDPVRQLAGGGIGTYGGGFASLAVVPLPRGSARTLVERLRSQGGQVDTPLVKGLLVESGFRTYLLVGFVPQAVLRAVGAELVRNPPPRRSDQ